MQYNYDRQMNLHDLGKLNLLRIALANGSEKTIA